MLSVEPFAFISFSVCRRIGWEFGSAVIDTWKRRLKEVRMLPLQSKKSTC